MSGLPLATLADVENDGLASRGGVVCLLRVAEASDGAAAVDAAIVEGYARAPAPEREAWAFAGALAAIKAEPW